MTDQIDSDCSVITGSGTLGLVLSCLTRRPAFCGCPISRCAQNSDVLNENQAENQVKSARPFFRLLRKAMDNRPTKRSLPQVRQMLHLALFSSERHTLFLLEKHKLQIVLQRSHEEIFDVSTKRLICSFQETLNMSYLLFQNESNGSQYISVRAQR